MPAIRSFYTLSVLAACLAQAWAGGYGGGSYGGSDAGSYGDSGMGGSGWGGGNDKWTSATWTSPMAVSTVNNAQSCPPPATMTETTTVTAVSPCSASVVTAYVTQWMNSPPGCWCGAGSPPPAAVSMWEMGGMDNAAVFTSTNAAFTPGLSSIPVSDAIKTGVTVAAAAAAPTPPAGAPAGAPPAGGSPGGFFTATGAASPTSGTETPGPSSVPSNVAEGTKTGEAESKAPATTSQSSATSSSTSSSISTSSSSLSSSTTSSQATTTSTSSKSSAPSPATKEVASASQSDFPVGSFSTLDPATLTLKNAYTLGIGKRAPFPTALS